MPDGTALIDSIPDDAFVTVPPVPTSSPGTTTTIPTIPTPASVDVLRQRRLYMQPDPLGPLSEAYGVTPVLLPPGEHVTDVLGIELTLDLDRWWRLDNEYPGLVDVTRVDTPIESDNPAVLFARPIGLAEPDDVAAPNALPGDHPVSPEDLGAWLEDVPQIEVVAAGDAMAGDRRGRWYDVDVDPSAGPVIRDECSPGACVRAWWSGGSGSIVARDGESLRYYEFPFPDGPVYALVVADDDEFDEWVEIADDLIRSVTFGPSEPQPIPPGYSFGLEQGFEAGREWRFIAFPGLAITPADYSISNQRPGRLLFEPWDQSSNAGNVVFVCPLQGADGRPMRSLDEVVDVLDASGLTRVADETIFETTSAVFTGMVDLDVPLFRRTPLIDDSHSPELVSWPEQYDQIEQMLVRVWAFESPIGPLLLVAESEGDEGLAIATGWAMDLVDVTRFDRTSDTCGSASTTGDDCATDSCFPADESVG